MKNKKIIHTTKSLAIVRLTGDNSLNPIFIKGNAKAQNIIGSPITIKKYFSESFLYGFDFSKFFF